jgi:hypothetical protein
MGMGSMVLGRGMGMGMGMDMGMGMGQFELVHPAEVQIWLELLFGDTPLPTG